MYKTKQNTCTLYVNTHTALTHHFISDSPTSAFSCIGVLFIDPSLSFSCSLFSPAKSEEVVGEWFSGGKALTVAMLDLLVARSHSTLGEDSAGCLVNLKCIIHVATGVHVHKTYKYMYIVCNRSPHDQLNKVTSYPPCFPGVTKTLHMHMIIHLPPLPILRRDSPIKWPEREVRE